MEREIKWSTRIIMKQNEKKNKTRKKKEKSTEK